MTRAQKIKAALAEYEKVRDAAWAEYEKVRDAALAELERENYVWHVKEVTEIGIEKNSGPIRVIEVVRDTEQEPKP